MEGQKVCKETETEVTEDNSVTTCNWYWVTSAKFSQHLQQSSKLYDIIYLRCHLNLL